MRRAAFPAQLLHNSAMPASSTRIVHSSGCSRYNTSNLLNNSHLPTKCPAPRASTAQPVISVSPGCRRRRTAAGKLWGCSMLGVCGASITFHVSSGKWRDLGRKLDYW